MESTKATALDAEAERRGLGLLRFDYSGHGRSDGRIEEGTISRWLEETLAIVRAVSEGPQILVGSSMGGYLALLAARALNEAGDGRIKGLILIAPAVDFTEALIWARAPDEARRAIMEKGAWRGPSPYSDEPNCFTRELIEDGRKHLLLGGTIRTRAPTVVLQGMLDEDVPYAHALALMARLGGDPATLTLIKDGDHRCRARRTCSSCSTRLRGWCDALPFSAKRGRWPEGPDGVRKAGMARCKFAVIVLQSGQRPRQRAIPDRAYRLPQPSWGRQAPAV